MTTREVLDFDAWVTPRVAGLLRFAYLVIGSQEAAEDAVQTALTAAMTKWDRVGRAEDPEQYVRRMITNADISAWRRWRRREVPVTPVDVGRNTASPDPSDEVARRELVWRLCAGLPPRQRAAVVLRYYEDLDYPEIARTLQISEATARSHVHRALENLRARLTSEDHAERGGDR